MRRAALAGLAAALIAASPAWAEAPWPSGIYGDVRMSGETGDLGGMEARFYQDGDRRMVEFVWCEGWCNAAIKAPVTRTAGGFAFAYVEHYADGGSDSAATMRFLVRPEGKRIRVSAWQNETSLDEGRARLLAPLKRPFGLSVANQGED